MNYRLFSVVFLVPFFISKEVLSDEMNNYELAELDYKSGMKYKDIAEKYNVSLNTVKSWKTRYWGKVADKKVCTQKKGMHTRKKAKEVAKILVEEGATIREASDKVGLPRSTVGDISSKENLQQTQLENLKSFRDEYRKEIRENKLKRLALNNKSLKRLAYEIEYKAETSKADFEKIKLSEEIEQLIFESDRIERLERFELEKAKKVKKANLPPAYFDDMDQELDNEE